MNAWRIISSVSFEFEMKCDVFRTCWIQPIGTKSLTEPSQAIRSLRYVSERKMIFHSGTQLLPTGSPIVQTAGCEACRARLVCNHFLEHLEALDEKNLFEPVLTKGRVRVCLYCYLRTKSSAVSLKKSLDPVRYVKILWFIISLINNRISMLIPFWTCSSYLS